MLALCFSRPPPGQSPTLFEPGVTPSLTLPSSLTPLLGLGHPSCPFQDSDSDTEEGAAGGEAESKCLPGGGLGGDLGSGDLG